MGESFHIFLRFISDNFIYIAGAIGILAYTYEIYHNIRRDGPRKSSDNVKTVIFLGSSIVSMFVAFYLFQSAYEIKHAATIAGGEIAQANENCLAHNPQSNDASQAQAENPVSLQCLAYAFQAYAPQEASLSASTNLYQDVELGNALLQNASMAATLKKYFGIKPASFLGTGFSVPSSQNEPESDAETGYGDVRAREYFVLNSCAEKMPGGQCDTRNGAAWAWTLDTNNLASKSVEDVVLRALPNDGRDEYKAFLNDWQLHPLGGPLLIRFGKFQSKYYVGTVGRPEAVYVFFSSYEDTKGLSLRDAFLASGATEKDLDERKEGEKLFVWVVAPFGAAQHRYLATWHNLFVLLRGIDVDERVKEFAEFPSPNRTAVELVDQSRMRPSNYERGHAFQ